jgi:Glycosyltransferase family 87
MGPGRAEPLGRFALAALGVLVLAFLFAPSVRPAGLMRDFNAFYCAGQTLNAGADPYRAEPLGSCERAPKPDPLLAGQAGLTAPAPLPPYALVPFRALAFLPYVSAAIVWTLLGIGAVVAAVWAMRKITGLPLLALVAAFALGDGYASLCLGQVAPIAVAAIAVAAWLLREGRDEWAGCAAGIAMIEPHIGLPLCASLFVWRARTRVPLLGFAVVCVAASVLTSGVPISLEYVRGVLPAHALSEIANEKQFSLTYALHRLGAPDEAALRAGELWYAVMLLGGVWAAGKLATRYKNAAAIAVIPPALAVFGGPFVHIIQIAAALPAALLLYVAAPARLRRTIGIAIVALAIPWIQFANLGTIFVGLAAVVAALLVASFVDDRPIFGVIAGCAAIGIVETAIALVRPVPDVSALLRIHYDPAALAEQSWTLYVRALGSANAAAFDFAKLPTVGALCALAYAVIVEAFRTTESRRGAFLPNGEKGAVIPRRIAQ